MVSGTGPLSSWAEMSIETKSPSSAGTLDCFQGGELISHALRCSGSTSSSVSSGRINFDRPAS